MIKQHTDLVNCKSVIIDFASGSDLGDRQKTEEPFRLETNSATRPKTMKSEVKYIPQNGDNCGKMNPVYNATTIPQFHRSKDFSQRFYTRLGILIATLSLVLCAAILVVFFMGNGAKDAEIRELQQKIEAQQIRLHRMNKEMQFLMSRQKAYEAREEMLERNRNSPNSFVSDFIRNFEPELVKSKSFEGSVIKDDTWLPAAVPGEEEDDTLRDTVSDKWLPEEEVDVSKLPVASPNKKKGQGKSVIA